MSSSGRRTVSAVFLFPLNQSPRPMAGILPKEPNRRNPADRRTSYPDPRGVASFNWFARFIAVDYFFGREHTEEGLHHGIVGGARPDGGASPDGRGACGRAPRAERGTRQERAGRAAASGGGAGRRRVD